MTGNGKGGRSGRPGVGLEGGGRPRTRTRTLALPKIRREFRISNGRSSDVSAVWGLCHVLHIHTSLDGPAENAAKPNSLVTGFNSSVNAFALAFGDVHSLCSRFFALLSSITSPLKQENRDTLHVNSLCPGQLALFYR